MIVLTDRNLSFWRQLEMFDPSTFDDDIHIIGCGATGQWAAFTLAKMGVCSNGRSTMHLYDFDVHEAHNGPNQVLGLPHNGQLKVDAMAEMLRTLCGTDVETHVIALGDPESNEEIVKEFKEKHPDVELVLPDPTWFSGYVFLLVDTMWARKHVWEAAIRYNINVKLMVETRLSAELFKIHTIQPSIPVDVKGFERTLFKDGEGEAPQCTYRAISPTVINCAAIAADKVRRFHVQFEKNDRIKPVTVLRDSEKVKNSNYDMINMRPLVMTAANWRK